jgi:AcrR family transcriptional regulator
LRAALEVLAEGGLPGFTIEAVAHRAGASKATVYRHWTSQAALLIDAMDLTFEPFPFPSTGRLRTDLIKLISMQEAMLKGHLFPRLMAAFIDAAELDPSLKDLHADLTERRREPGRRLLAEARRRGEISPSTDVELAIDLLAGPAFYRRFVAHKPFPRTYATAVVNYVLRAIGYTEAESHKRPRKPAPR